MSAETLAGDAAALRAVLEKIVRIAEEWDTPGIHAVQTTLYRIIEAARAALSAPPRNCDVGTAEEQERRYFKLKTEFIDRITKCPHVGYSYFPESLEWAQMPYEEGSAE